MKRKLGVLVVIAVAAVALFTLFAFATDAQMYFSSDKNGQHRVTNIQEGDEIWIVVIDNDQNTDCDIRDKMWPDVKVMDPKTGAYIIWDTGEGTLADDYLEETGADTGVFVSKRAFQIGTREDYAEEYKNTHVIDQESSPPDDFMWGAYLYSDIEQEQVPLKGVPGVRGDIQRWVGAYGEASPLAYDVGFVYAALGDYEVPSDLETTRREAPSKWLIGRFENMDTLVGMYQDPNDLGDVAIAMMKIIDVEAAISWDQDIYKDANETATITVADADENLNCNQVEYVPVFILVNPGGWNPSGTTGVDTDQTNDSPNNFCMLKRTGGVDASDPDPTSNVGDYRPIRWFNIYNAEKNDFGTSGAEDGRYYVQYPDLSEDIDIHKQLFDTVNGDGITAVSFYAQETGVSTGVFQLNLNSILEDLGFNSLQVRDVLVAYYLDPNDEDDFKLATAYIEERQHSISSFTDATRADKDLYWIGRDPVYVQVIDANANVDPCCPEDVIAHICDPHGEDDGEFWVLNETSSNSPVFFSIAGMELLPVWDALGVGVGDENGDMLGGYQLVLDNWKLETFNEDEVYVRYNDVQYMAGDNGYAGLADISTITAYSGPRIDRIRLGNDVSFDLMSIADTQVFDGAMTQMWFLDRQGNRVSGYVTSDCLFVEVLDSDQDEDQYRRERIDAYWDGGQNYPFGPLPRNVFGCEFERVDRHPVNDLLGDTNIFNDSPDPYDREDGAAKIYVLNPRNGRWAGIDLLETGASTGDFVSVVCIDLVHVYECVPTLGVLPGDTIVAVYQDPSNHSDSAWISVKVGIGGGGTAPSQQSTTMFVDAEGNEVANYTDDDMVYVKVIDPSHAGATLLASAVEIDGIKYDATPMGAADTFVTAGLDLGLAAAETLTATYTDPTDQTDTSSDTITVIASVLVVDSFYAGPNPFEGEVTFGFNGTGIASTMTVAIYDLAGGVVYETTQTDVSEITWDGAGLANGGYLYIITATDGTNTFNGNGKVFINR